MLTRISTSITEGMLDDLEQNFKTNYIGMRICIDSFLVLKRFAHHKINNYFTSSEKTYIKKMIGKKKFIPSLSSRFTLLTMLQEGSNKAVVEKVKKLNDFECFYLFFENQKFN